MDFNKYEAFSITLGEALRELTMEAINKKIEIIGSLDEDFEAGYLAAFHRVITLIQQQAEIFEINLSDICLDNLKESDFT